MPARFGRRAAFKLIDTHLQRCDRVPQPAQSVMLVGPQALRRRLGLALRKTIALRRPLRNLRLRGLKAVEADSRQFRRPGLQSRRGVASTTKRLNHVKTRLRTPRPTVTRRQTVKHRDNLVRNNNRNLHRKVLESNVTEKMMDGDSRGNAPSKFPDAARQGRGT
jgi:hypothetical protein